MAAIIGASREVDSWLQHFTSMRNQRVDFDRKWQLVSDYILPRRDFSVTQRPNALRPHRVTSSVATNANTRMAAFMLAYMIDPANPFLTPNVKRGLVAAGRSTDLDDAGLDYLGELEWSIFSHLMLPKARLMLRLGSILKEFCAFGCGVMWTGRKRGFGPYFNARPVQACWWTENEEGEIDTLYFKMMLPVYRVLERWPEARKVNGWDQEKVPNENQLTSVLLCCRPRAGGISGAHVLAKPFAYVVIAEEKSAIIEESGYDSFPYAVFRYDPMPGNAYAEGPGCQVLPDVMVLNHLQAAVEDCASQKAAPPIAVPARMFGKTIDRRPGAVTSYNPAGLGLARADQAILKLDFTGDPTEAVAYIQELTANIEAGYFVDWMRPRETGDQTAAEINDRRDIRLRGMASIVANTEQPMTVLGDRALDIMNAEGMLAPAPASVARAEVDWEYSGPLAIAQLARNAQSVIQVLNVRALVKQDDPAAAEAVDLEEALRIVAESVGAPTRLLQSRSKVAAIRAANAHKAQQDADAARLQQVAGAAKDGGAGIASVAGALGGPGGPPAGQGGPPAPFAPVQGLNQPIAA